jgi:hypothetical protein
MFNMLHVRLVAPRALSVIMLILADGGGIIYNT